MQVNGIGIPRLASGLCFRLSAEGLHAAHDDWNSRADRITGRPFSSPVRGLSDSPLIHAFHVERAE